MKTIARPDLAWVLAATVATAWGCGNQAEDVAPTLVGFEDVDPGQLDTLEGSDAAATDALAPPDVATDAVADADLDGTADAPSDAVDDATADAATDASDAEQPCKTSKECPAVCDVVKGVCVECLTADDCAKGLICTPAATCGPPVCTTGMCANGQHFSCNADGSGYGAGVACGDGNPCTDDSCDPAAGCLSVPHTKPCDDGDPCTLGEACSAGVCGGGSPAKCVDASPCTVDSCQQGKGCVFSPIAGACDDGDPCTAGDACLQGACFGTSFTDCSDGDPCTDDACDAKKGCVSTPNLAPCNDANACTSGETCNAGLCAGGAPVTCTDGNACTDDACDPKSGCKFTANTATCDDGDKCTSGDKCSANSCKGVPVSCDDGNACTVGEACLNGACQAGQNVVCGDGNACTSDACDPKAGCKYVENANPCNDNNACTNDDKCSGGQCKGTALDCNDGNACTDDSCQAGVGCVKAANSASCKVGDVCGACSGGTCQAGSALWDKTYGSVGADDIHGIAPTSGAGYLFAGSAAGNGPNNTDFWCGRIKADGSLISETKLGGAGIDFASGVAAYGGGADGHIVVGARTYANQDAYLLRLDASGVQVWERVYGSVGPKGNIGADQFNAVHVTESGGFVAAGRFNRDSNGASNATVAGFDAQGNWLWDYDAFTTQYGADEVLGIAPVPNGGGTVVTGYIGGHETFLAQISPTGKKLWQSMLSAGANGAGWGVLVLSDGFLVVGSRSETADSAMELRLVKTTLNGIKVWDRTYPGLGAARGRGVVAVTGGFAVMGRTSTSNNAQNDLWLLQTDAKGERQWDAKYGAGADDAGETLLALADGGFLLAGSTASKGAGGSDGWLLRTDRWGYTSCQASGACATVTTCDDGKGCTADACSPIGGCSNTPIVGCVGP